MRRISMWMRRRRLEDQQEQPPVQNPHFLSSSQPSALSMSPRLPDPLLSRLIASIKDWAICNGLLLKSIRKEQIHSSVTYPVGVTVYPSEFPANLYRQACELSVLFNELYVAVTRDPQWMKSVLEDLIRTDPLTGTLWAIYEKSQETSPQDHHALHAGLGIFRSDYMLHQPSAGSNLQLKQVEFNTSACAGVAHGNRAANLHRYLVRSGHYNSGSENNQDSLEQQGFNIPQNENVASLIEFLVCAHQKYAEFHRDSMSQACVLMVVQPWNFNIADERPFEQGLWSLDPPVPTFRLEWGNILNNTALTETGALVYHPPELPKAFEVSVVYYRAGFVPEEFNPDGPGFDSRLRLEMSRAFQCPPLLAHLITLKKIQQALCLPGSVERFLPAEKAALVRETFMPMFPLDASPLGLQGRSLATNPETAVRYVLKPSREGGGHNVYRDEIPKFLARIPESRWHEFVLQEVITPRASSNNILLSSQGIYEGPTVTELGIIGACFWKMDGPAESEAGDGFLINKQAGWSVRTKRANVDEMSVVKGYGCFDSLNLVEDLVSLT